MDLCPEIYRILNSSRMRSHLNTLILNSNISSTCHYKKTTYIISYTYAFDALIVGIVVTYNDHPTYKAILDHTNNEILMMGNMILYMEEARIFISHD